MRTRISLTIALLLGSTLTLSTLTTPVQAAPPDRRWEPHEIQHWRHGDIRAFHERDLDRWRGGRWFHGDHVGRSGWWWIVDGAWYFYPAPVYPYPDPYVPPAVAMPAPAPAAPASWYYCQSLREYYPYVTACPEPWVPVAAQPAP